MADVTLAVFKEQVLKELRIHAPGEVIPPAHLSIVTSNLNDIFGELDHDNVVDWVTTGDIPSNRVATFRQMVMNRVGVHFGKPYDEDREKYFIGRLRALRTAVAATDESTTY